MSTADESAIRIPREDEPSPDPQLQPEPPPQRRGRGRPWRWTSPQDLQDAIDRYFDSCWQDVQVTTTVGRRKVTTTRREQFVPYTVSGLALALGTSRQTLLDYEKDRGEEFADVMKRAKLRVEDSYERYLVAGKNPVGAIFALKNHFGWVDKHEVERKEQTNILILQGELGDMVKAITSRITRQAPAIEIPAQTEPLNDPNTAKTNGNGAP